MLALIAVLVLGVQPRLAVALMALCAGVYQLLNEIAGWSERHDSSCMTLLIRPR